MSAPITIVFPSAADRRLLSEANERADWFEGARRSLCLTPEDWSAVSDRVAFVFGGEEFARTRADDLGDDVMTLVDAATGAAAADDELPDDDYGEIVRERAWRRCVADRRAPILREWAQALGRRAR